MSTETKERWLMPIKFNGIVNVQVCINRAVWAYNLDGPSQSGSFKTEAERDAYINSCLTDARKEIARLLKKTRVRKSKNFKITHETKT